jgi:hypothetical protein
VSVIEVAPAVARRQNKVPQINQKKIMLPGRSKVVLRKNIEALWLFL